MIKELDFYNGKAIITFDDIKHKFRDSKNRIIPSVTKATGIIDKSGPLMWWTAKMMGLYLLNEKANGNKIITEKLIESARNEYRRAQEEAKDIGTEIHAWISDWIGGKKPELPNDERVVNGVRAFLKFQDKYKFKWIESERIIYSRKHNFAGILDATATNAGGKKVLVDFKSANEKMNKKTGEMETPVYAESAFQSAGYQLALEEETGEEIDHRIVIAFGKKTGKFNFEEFKENKKDKKTFLACLAVRNRLTELK